MLINKSIVGGKKGAPLTVIVCPSRVALGVLLSIKCGIWLARHRSCKNNRNSGFKFGGSRLA